MKKIIFIFINILVFAISSIGLIFSYICGLQYSKFLEILPSIITSSVSNCFLISITIFVYFFFTNIRISIEIKKVSEDETTICLYIKNSSNSEFRIETIQIRSLINKTEDIIHIDKKKEIEVEKVFTNIIQKPRLATITYRRIGTKRIFRKICILWRFK